MLFLQICQVTRGDLEAIGNLGAGEKAVSHFLFLTNSSGSRPAQRQSAAE